MQAARQLDKVATTSHIYNVKVASLRKSWTHTASKVAFQTKVPCARAVGPFKCSDKVAIVVPKSVVCVHGTSKCSMGSAQQSAATKDHGPTQEGEKWAFKVLPVASKLKVWLLRWAPSLQPGLRKVVHIGKHRQVHQTKVSTCRVVKVPAQVRHQLVWSLKVTDTYKSAPRRVHWHLTSLRPYQKVDVVPIPHSGSSRAKEKCQPLLRRFASKSADLRIWWKSVLDTLLFHDL